MIFYCLLDFIIKKTDGAQFFLRYSGLLEVISWELGEEMQGAVIVLSSIDQVCCKTSSLKIPFLKLQAFFSVLLRFKKLLAVSYIKYED